MIPRFEEWLVDQQDREDHVGALARILIAPDIPPKPTGRKTDEHKSWADVVIEVADPGDVATFNDAWQEFRLQKQDAIKSSTQ